MAAIFEDASNCNKFPSLRPFSKNPRILFYRRFKFSGQPRQPALALSPTPISFIIFASEARRQIECGKNSRERSAHEKSPTIRASHCCRDTPIRLALRTEVQEELPIRTQLESHFPSTVLIRLGNYNYGGLEDSSDVTEHIREAQ